jgi:hypothetical protein
MQPTIVPPRQQGRVNSTSIAVRERGKTVDDAIRLYTNQGYTLIARTDTSITLVRPSTFSAIVAILSLFGYGVGLLYYLAIFLLLRPDKTVIVTTDRQGLVTRVERSLARRSEARLLAGAATMLVAILLTLLMLGAL